ncbi:MAG: hypothetical protein RDU83_03880 [bacterium]|nr:hypothetical protein [bacterium]
MHFGLVAPEAILRLNDYRCDFTLLGRFHQLPVSGPVGDGPGNLTILVDVPVVDGEAKPCGGFVAEGDLIVNGGRGL